MFIWALEIRTLRCCWCEYKMVQLSSERACSFSKIKHKVTLWSSNSTINIVLKKWKCVSIWNLQHKYSLHCSLKWKHPKWLSGKKQIYKKQYTLLEFLAVKWNYTDNINEPLKYAQQKNVVTITHYTLFIRNIKNRPLIIQRRPVIA